MKKTLAVILFISIILLGAAFALKGVTERITQREHIELMELLLPDGKDFTKEEYNGDDTNIRSVHKSDKGYIIEAVTRGYADDIRMFIGVTNEGTVTGLVVYEARETFGLGSKILTDHVFLSRFLNKSGTFTVESTTEDATSWATTEVTAGENEIYIDGISGATVSSKAVVRCINSAVAYVTGVDTKSSATTWGG